MPADEEAGTFGDQIRRAFQLAGWSVSGGVAGTLSVMVIDGSRTRVFHGDGFTCSANQNAPELARALKAFEVVGLKCTVRNDLPNDSHSPLGIVIGKRN